MKNSSPLVSVIIPTYNREVQLKKCLKSLQEQTFKNFEVIVCDDGSTDNTKEIVEKFKDKLFIKYIQDINFGGPARPRNNGIRIAEGVIIAFLDSDDWWYPTKLEKSLQNIEKYDIIYHDLDKYTKLDKSKGVIRGRVLYGDIAKNLIIKGNGIPNSSVLIRKNIVDLVGEISEDKNLIAVEDSDYWIRVAQVTNKFYYIKQSLGAYWVGHNISVSEKQILREETLFNKHKHILDLKEIDMAVKLLAFRKARVFHKISKFKEAREEYVIAFQLSSYSIKLKSFIGQILAFLNIKV